MIVAAALLKIVERILTIFIKKINKGIKKEKEVNKETKFKAPESDQKRI